MFILSLTDIVSHHKMNLFHILCFFFSSSFCSCRFANLCRIYTYYRSHTKSTFYSDKIKKMFESFHFDESYFDRDFMSHRTVLSKKPKFNDKKCYIRRIKCENTTNIFVSVEKNNILLNRI